MPISIISKHLDSALRRMADEGENAISQEDKLDLVLAELITLKVRKGWTISEAGRKYLSANPRLGDHDHENIIIPPINPVQ